MLKHTSEAKEKFKTDEFLANLESMAGSKTDGRVKIFGNAKCDNCGRVPLARVPKDAH
jgi:hypothetical protein